MLGLLKGPMNILGCIVNWMGKMGQRLTQLFCLVLGIFLRGGQLR